MAIGTTAMVLMGLGLLGGTIAGMATTKKKTEQATIEMPEAPTVTETAEKAREAFRRRRRYRSIYTSPLGISGEAQIARKTLLGQ